MNFTAIDFETANSARCSVCSIGLVRVENNEVVEEIHQLINPCTTFNYYNTVVHSITSIDVRYSPTFADYFPQIKKYFCDNVVAHNAPFDISCLRDCIQRYNLNISDFNHFCTLAISKKILALKCNKLDFLAQYFDLPTFNHHNALEDARTCSELFRILSKKTDVSTFAKSFLNLKKTKSANKKTPIQILENNISLAQKAKLAKLKALKAKILFDSSPIDFSKNFFVNCKTENLSISNIESLILKEGAFVSNEIDILTNYIVIDPIDPLNPPDDSIIDAIYQALSLPHIRFIDKNSLFYHFF